MLLDQIIALLRATPALLHTLLATLPATITQVRPAPGEWCINEVIGHLIEAEQRGFAGRMRLILTEAHHRCQTWDPDQVARARRDQEKPVTILLAEFHQIRATSLELVHTLQPEQLTRAGEHPTVGVLTVSDLLHEWVYHDLNHLKQIESCVMASFWDQLHNAQKFYQ
jgi:DinB superfamily